MLSPIFRVSFHMLFSVLLVFVFVRVDFFVVLVIESAWHVIAKHPGQFLAGLGRSILVGWICLACNFPLAEWWHLLLLVVAIAGSGVLLSKLYGRR